MRAPLMPKMTEPATAEGGSDSAGRGPAGRRNRWLWWGHVGFHVAAWGLILANLAAAPPWSSLLLLVPVSAVAGLVGLAFPGFRAGVSLGLLRAALVVSVLGLAPAVWVVSAGFGARGS